LTIKQSFQLLNTLGFGLKHKVMFLVRKSYQIAWAVISLNAIKVMHYPALRQWLAMRLLPNNNMFSDIAISIGSWMLRSPQKHISTAFHPSALPIRVFVSLPCIIVNQTRFVHISIVTWPTTLGGSNCNHYSTIYTASWLSIFSHSFMSTNRASFRPLLNKFAAVYTRMLMPPSVILLCSFQRFTHINIIPYFYQYINLNQCKELRQEMPDG